MTPRQLEWLDEMYNLRKMPIAEIAKAMHFDETYVAKVMAEDRKRFPKRRRSVDEKKMGLWVARILAGRATPRQAADAMGVSVNCVRDRVRNAKARMAQEPGV